MGPYLPAGCRDLFVYILSNFLLTTNFDLKEVFRRESRKIIDMGILKKENTKKTKKSNSDLFKPP